jgi:hypothetical protein
MTTSTDTRTYPLPPAPSWADACTDDQGFIRHEAAFGEVGTVGVLLARADWVNVKALTVEVDEVRVYVVEHVLTTSEARELAELLLAVAAIRAEQS